MRQKVSVLVIDDDQEVLNLLKITLGVYGFEVITAKDAIMGMHAAYQYHPDAILLDVMMPKIDGFEACRQLRSMTSVPIIFVTAKSLIGDVIKGFRAGADDYVTKPFNHEELLARLKVCLHYAVKDQNDYQGFFETGFEDWQVEDDRHEIIIKNQLIYLPPKEFEILRYLIRHLGRVLSADAILSNIWGPEYVGDRNMVKQHIYRLRQLIEPDPKKPIYIRTAPGEGYYLDVDYDCKSE
ncbi:MAG: response regulator transcription factor [Anaerolineae bacterium]|nr:response regulator transcription factor [Anaerolineae bacterium]